ncbi:hypothetical protein CPB84DRAFT_1852997 [Gymnopilus junonius]|uniref:Uncharacterized protein n=1 Tax=Gymnopilus junonius TaxID=109634 RepID=A0A9P5N9Z8_GYMJU|nr:hypothetical protein CPB84DRAFT_1852997 [Gymnopilus junonius]
MFVDHPCSCRLTPLPRRLRFPPPYTGASPEISSNRRRRRSDNWPPPLSTSLIPTPYPNPSLAFSFEAAGAAYAMQTPSNYHGTPICPPSHLKHDPIPLDSFSLTTRSAHSGTQRRVLAGPIHPRQHSLMAPAAAAQPLHLAVPIPTPTRFHGCTVEPTGHSGGGHSSSLRHLLCTRHEACPSASNYYALLVHWPIPASPGIPSSCYDYPYPRNQAYHSLGKDFDTSPSLYSLDTPLLVHT